MNRRQLLTTGGVVAGTLVAGCLGGDDEAESTGGNDGYGPEPDTIPEERSVDTDAYETTSFDGVDVPLAPIEDVSYWYQRQEARVVDARGTDAFEDSRIAGAVLSTAPDGVDPDPVAEWSTDDRIVTYCVCPHALSGQRASTLIEAGYDEVYVLDEGYQAWVEAGYPIEGAAVEDGGAASLSAYQIRGESDPAYAGEYVTLRTAEGDHREMSAVDDDGSYELTLHATDLDSDSLLLVEAPDYTRELTLAELEGTVVTA